MYGPGGTDGTPTAPSDGGAPATTQVGSPPDAPAGVATLISQSRPTIASTFESAGFAARGATDGDDTTRWSSQFLDKQWLRVDFGSTAEISKVVLHWENSYASGFEIQTSDNGADWKPIYTTTTGKGGTQTLDVTGSGRYIRLYTTARATAHGVSLWEFQAYGTLPGAPAPGGPGYIPANPQVTGATPANGNPAHALFHEFQANCNATHDAPDDPIVYPGKPGASHMHTFLGNTITNASTTPADLKSSPPAACKAPGDKSAYWMPTLYNGDKAVDPVGPQVIYYKTGIRDYTAVRPFPPGLRFVVGDPKATAEEFHDQPGFVEGFECGNASWNIDIPATCPVGTELNIRFQAPSCWNGLYLDTPDHKSHMAYAVDGVCPKDHPIALPMLEFKMAFPVNGDMSQVHFSSGRGFSFHYDFMNAWDQPTLQALVTHCINGGLQCNARGYDETQPGKGAALNEQYLLP
ncbi:DUF1996 domain-containing protein [Streptomyces sp. NPDC051976]|uniref:DUF1996 domain-containing protein n=1 Tax=Streptomyces sp. NPDC051976 TaxID=3154947 RepID=UPI00341B36E2